MIEIAELFANAAIAAQRSGFDVIQVNASNGWLLSQFLSPLTNHRTDEYGGSVENRCRFPVMIIKAIKEATGMPIELRMNAYDGLEIPEGIQPEDAAQQALIFEAAGVDMLHFSTGNRLNPATRPEMTPSVARLVAARLQQLNMPLRWYSIPNLYRNEQPQRGRLREFWQINADIFGCNSYEADLEIIRVAIDMLLCFGADESMFVVRINNRRFFNDVIAKICDMSGEDARLVSKVIDRREKVTREAYVASLVELGLTHWNLAVTLATFDVFLMEKFESDAYPFQFLMHVFVIRIAVHGLVRELLRVKESVDLRLPKCSDIVVTNALLVSDVEDFTDRMP